jgi:hypothetical protein
MVRMAGEVRRLDLDVVVLLPILGSALASMELGGALGSKLVSSAWCSATDFGSSGYPPPVSVVRLWLEMAAGGGEIGIGYVRAAAPGWWAC